MLSPHMQVAKRREVNPVEIKSRKAVVIMARFARMMVIFLPSLSCT